MSAMPRAWLADQAEAINYQRLVMELDAYANPSQPVLDAAAQLRAALKELRNPVTKDFQRKSNHQEEGKKP